MGQDWYLCPGTGDTITCQQAISKYARQLELFRGQYVMIFFLRKVSSWSSHEAGKELEASISPGSFFKGLTGRQVFDTVTWAERELEGCSSDLRTQLLSKAESCERCANLHEKGRRQRKPGATDQFHAPTSPAASNIPVDPGFHLTIDKLSSPEQLGQAPACRPRRI